MFDVPPSTFFEDEDLDALSGLVGDRYAEEGTLIKRIKEAGSVGAPERGLRPSELARLALIERIVSRGLPAMIARRRTDVGRAEGVAIAKGFAAFGAAFILNAGSQRGGDFLLNQLRGQWAENVSLSMEIPGSMLVQFGPSSAAMPGEADHDATVKAFRQIVLTEGKRPDLLAFSSERWHDLTTDQRSAVGTWPVRPIRDDEHALVASAECGIEVKNSTWAYKRRRASGNTKPLSITVKDEELEDLEGWTDQTGLPILFFQVLFDELYCMSFERMRQAIRRGRVYEEGDYVSRPGAAKKKVHWFLLTPLMRRRHQLADVVFPSASEAIVRPLEDGNVVPYIVFKPAEVEKVNAAAYRQELAWGLGA